MNINDLLNEQAESHHSKTHTRTVEITLHATMSTDLEYTETVTIPANMSDEEIQELWHEMHEEIDGGSFDAKEGFDDWSKGSVDIGEAPPSGAGRIIKVTNKSDKKIKLKATNRIKYNKTDI